MPINIKDMDLDALKSKSEIMEEIMRILSANKDKAFKASELIEKIKYHDTTYVPHILSLLKRMGKVKHNRPWWHYKKEEKNVN